MNAVSKNLKEIRRAKGLTQDQLAEALHVTRQAVSSWETGRSEPDIETLLALATAAQCAILTGQFRLIFSFVWNTQTSLWIWTRAVPSLGGFLIFLGFNRR